MQAKKMKTRQIVSMLLGLIVMMGHSLAVAESMLKTEQFWVALPPPVAKGTAAYGVIKNTGSTADTLIGVSSDSASIMLHKTEIHSGMAKMMHMSHQTIKAGESLILTPMSYHLMLSNLAPNAFEQGGVISIYLEFEKAGKVKIEVPVLDAAPE